MSDHGRTDPVDGAYEGFYPEDSIAERLTLGVTSEKEALAAVIDLIDSLTVADRRRLANLGSYALAEILSRATPAMWNKIQSQAQRSDLFSYALAFAYLEAFSAPDQAKELLQKSGWISPVNISFLAVKMNLEPPTIFDWRALNISEGIDRFELARLLRQIAHYLDWGGDGDARWSKMIKRVDREALVRLDQGSLQTVLRIAPAWVRDRVSSEADHYVRVIVGPTENGDHDSDVYCRIDVQMDDGERVFTTLGLTTTLFNALSADLDESRRREVLAREQEMRSLSSWVRDHREGR